jgi:hypothetical protein
MVATWPLLARLLPCSVSLVKVSIVRYGRFPSSDGMSTAQLIRADPFSESGTQSRQPLLNESVIGDSWRHRQATSFARGNAQLQFVEVNEEGEAARIAYAWPPVRDRRFCCRHQIRWITRCSGSSCSANRGQADSQARIRPRCWLTDRAGADVDHTRVGLLHGL